MGSDPDIKICDFKVLEFSLDKIIWVEQGYKYILENITVEFIEAFVKQFYDTNNIFISKIRGRKESLMTIEEQTPFGNISFTANDCRIELYKE